MTGFRHQNEGGWRDRRLKSSHLAVGDVTHKAPHSLKSCTAAKISHAQVGDSPGQMVDPTVQARAPSPPSHLRCCALFSFDIKPIAFYSNSAQQREGGSSPGKPRQAQVAVQAYRNPHAEFRQVDTPEDVPMDVRETRCQTPRVNLLVSFTPVGGGLPITGSQKLMGN